VFAAKRIVETPPTASIGGGVFDFPEAIAFCVLKPSTGGFARRPTIRGRGLNFAVFE